MPVGSDFELVPVFQSDLTTFREPPIICKAKIDMLRGESHVLGLRHGAVEHLLVQHDLIWIVDRDLEVQLGAATAVARLLEADF